MKVVPMKAERRTALGRRQVAHIRKEGWMPAIVYGEGQENVAISISEWELEQHLKAHHKVYSLDIGGTKQAAFLQDVAYQTLNDRPLHADFRRIDLTKPIETEMEVTLIGHPIGLAKGGVLVKDHLQLTIRCLPTAIPDLIEHDVSKLDMDEHVEAGQIALPEGVELVSDADMSICHVEEIEKLEVDLTEAQEAAASAAAAEAAKPDDAKKPDGAKKADEKKPDAKK